MNFKNFIISSMTVFILMMTILIVNADSNINVVVNGNAVNFNDDTGYPYVDENDRTMTPLRTTMECAGFAVGYDESKQTAIVITEYHRIEIPIGTNKIYVDNELKENDTDAVIKDGRTYLPIRIVFESANYTVDWNAKAKVIKVYPKYYHSSVWENTQIKYLNDDLNVAIYPQPSRYSVDAPSFISEKTEDFDVDGIVDEISEETRKTLEGIAQ